MPSSACAMVASPLLSRTTQDAMQSDAQQLRVATARSKGAARTHRPQRVLPRYASRPAAASLSKST